MYNGWKNYVWIILNNINTDSKLKREEREKNIYIEMRERSKIS